MAWLYPDLPGARMRYMVRDALAMLVIVAFVMLGIRVDKDIGPLAHSATG